MKIRNLALVLGAAFTVAAGGFAATACSSSSNNTPVGGGNDSGTHADTGTTGNDSGGGGMDSGMMGDDGGGMMGPDCGSTPSLHVDEAGTIYCGFMGDAGALDCPSGQECCLGGSLGGGMYQPQQCATWGGACPNNGTGDGGSAAAIPIECNQNSDCTANGKTANVCCLVGASNKTVPGCNYPKYSGGTAIQCEMGTNGACASGETQVCSQDSDCPSGMHCVAGKWKIFQVGFCQ